MNELKRYFITGIVTLIPITVTVVVFWFFISRLGSVFRPLLTANPFLERLPKEVLSVFSFILLIIVILVIGALTSGIFGRWLLGFIDDLLSRLPVVRSVYSSARQLTNAVFVDKKSLRKTVLAEYPRKGVYAIGFLMAEEKIKMGDKLGLFVYFPTTPTPTTGFLAIVPEDEVIETNLSIEEGMKLVVSGGVVCPAEVKRWQIENGSIKR